MNLFRTTEDLKRSIAEAGLGTYEAAILATARPTVVFARRQVDDDGLPAGATKLGGFPDLPDGFAWPIRAPFPDAARRADELRKAGQGAADIMRKVVKDEAAAARSIAQREAQALVQSRPMPLAFLAQFDLAALSKEPGFDRALPDAGLLSVFVDVTNHDWWRAHRVLWHEAAPASMKRTRPPDELVAWYDAHDSFGGPASEDLRWDKLAQADLLAPFSGISVPHHWRSLHPFDSALGSRFHDWLHSDAHKFRPKLPDVEKAGRSVDFGDQLGGWPPIIQGDVEDDIDGGAVGRTPGRTPWRQIFTYGGEHYGGSRRMTYEGLGDGAVYLMIRDDDLAARRFDAVQDVSQRT